MAAPAPPLSVTRQVAVWNRQVNADFRKLFVSLSQAAAHARAGKWIDAALKTAEALTAVGLESASRERS